MPVTAIKGFINQTQYPVEVKDHEDPTKPGHYLQLKAREGKPCDMWVPWCSSSTDFLGAHYITVQFNNTSPPTKIWIWQRDGKVEATSTESFSAPRRSSRRDVQEGGNRVVVLSALRVADFYPIS